MLPALIRLAPLTVLALSTPAFAASDPTGVWLDDSGRGAIEITTCGKAYCGHVVWTRDATDAKGCRKQMLGDVTSEGGGLYGGGWIYSPERRKNYDVELKPLSGDRLQVTGYAGVKLFSKTFVWTRAPADLKRCDATQDAKADTQKPVAVAAVDPAPAPVATPTKTLSDEPVTTPPPATTATLPRPVDVTPAPTPAPGTAPTPVPATKPAPPAVEAAKPAPPPAPVAEAPTTRGTEDDDQSADNDKPAIDLDKIFTRTNGDCKLDLPWVKLEFSCEDK